MTLKEFDVPLSALERRFRIPPAWMRLALSAMTGLADFIVILATAMAVAFVYHSANFGVWWYADTSLDFALLLAGTFVALGALTGVYQIANYVGANDGVNRTIGLWIASFVLLAAFSFGMKTTETYSRIIVVSTFLVGLPLLVMARFGMRRALTLGSKLGVVPTRRVMLVGKEADIATFARRYQPWNAGLEVVGAGILDPRGVEEPIDQTLARIGAQARDMVLDDVMVIVPWSRTEIIDKVVATFMRLPVAIHLGPERIFDRFDQIRINQSGGIASLQLGRPPLTLGEVAAKRVIDLVLASVGLVLLSPLFLLVAIAIKLDSRGPVFFLQRRLGFNQKAFRIWKFRTMTTLDDGPTIKQATVNDARITRLGALLRRLSVDELPQLINVVRGDMSLVGPRPHPIALDHKFDEKIALYARRHNVKPGITGWAQVHGLRGETDTDDKMRARVEYDLHYIDHWSIGLDVAILVRTVLSPRTFDNAR